MFCLIACSNADKDLETLGKILFSLGFLVDYTFFFLQNMPFFLHDNWRKVHFFVTKPYQSVKHIFILDSLKL